LNQEFSSHSLSPKRDLAYTATTSGAFGKLEMQTIEMKPRKYPGLENMNFDVNIKGPGRSPSGM
jgi:hypothetical protein